jgi:hypothetical protein
LLVRTLRHAVERQGLLHRLEQAELLAQHVREQEVFARMLPPGAVPVVATLYGGQSLREAQPQLFEELSVEYRHLLEQAAERQVYKVKHPVSDVSEAIERLAMRLGFVRASPRDLVELHTQCLRQLAGAAQDRVVTEEGRYLLLELMGHLTAYYRRYYPGGSKAGGHS